MNKIIAVVFFVLALTAGSAYAELHIADTISDIADACEYSWVKSRTSCCQSSDNPLSWPYCHTGSACCPVAQMKPNVGILNNIITGGENLFGNFGSCVLASTATCFADVDCTWEKSGRLWQTACIVQSGSDNYIEMTKLCSTCNDICQCSAPYDVCDGAETYTYPCADCDPNNPSTWANCQAEATCVNDTDCDQPSEQCREAKCLDNVCQIVNKTDGSVCDDGIFCNVGETCQSGVCQGGELRNCSDGLFCNGEELCINETCQPGIPVNCSGNNAPEIAQCDYSPDDISLTWDYRALFISVCNESADQCTTAPDITHTPNVTECGSECDSENPCAETDCSSLDHCQGNDFYDFFNKPNACLANGTCENNSCSSSADNISINDPRCVEGEIDSFVNESGDSGLKITFPDVGYGLVELTANNSEPDKNNRANFTRGQRMIIDFTATAHLIGAPAGEVIQCHGLTGPCAGAEVVYRIRKGFDGSMGLVENTTSVKWSDIALAWENKTRVDSRFECDEWYLVEANISKNISGFVVSAVNAEPVFVNCVPRMVIVPVEKRYALDAGPDKLFDVTIINPYDTQKTFDMDLQYDSSASALGIEFENGRQTKSIVVPAMSQDDSTHVMMSAGAQRAGSYYINIHAVSGSITLVRTGLVSVFAESLNEPVLAQFIGLLGGVGLVFLLI